MTSARQIVSAITLLLCTAFIALQSNADTFSWAQAHAHVSPRGDLQWDPWPFRFQASDTIRYIDFERGDDNGPGTRNRPWKHHPWDSNAQGMAAKSFGSITYVFKGGVIYRGAMEIPEGTAGTAAEPIRLTRDPAWGDGPALIYGSEAVTGLRKGANRADIPEAGRVWHVDLDFAPRAVWAVDGDGEIFRFKLAREPNWTTSDPDDVLSEWWTWENPQWWKKVHKTKVGSRKMHLGIDREHLTETNDFYEDGIVWTEWGIMMGAPFATKIEQFDSAQAAVAFQGPWHRDSGIIHRGNRYFLEDKPHYLDEPGEFWFEKQGEGGRLYLRMPGDAAPDSFTIETAKHINLIDGTNVNHIDISGLTFRFGNVYWDLTARFFSHEDVESAAVRFRGNGTGLAVRNCKFEQVSQAIRVAATSEDARMKDVRIVDNDILHTDHGAIEVAATDGSLGDVRVLRNRLFDIGKRPFRPNGHHALYIGYPETAEIAGNFLDRCYGAGLFVFGGKPSGGARDAPLSRILIHHNRVTNPLLASNDWGGIETWQGGPFYVYNNVSGNPGGYMNWTGERFGHAYYLDGAFKNYHFNNIAWGKNNSPEDLPRANTAAFQEIHSYQNTFFNNTAYKFLKGTRRQKSDAGRNKYLGNIFQDISQIVFRHSDKEEEDPNAADAGPQGDEFAYETNAYSRNLFFDIGGILGAFEARGGDYRTLSEFRRALARYHPLVSDVGIVADISPLRGPEQRDFRLKPGSVAADLGVRVFVPWSIYATVGEWNFTLNHQDPSSVLDEHWYLTPYHVERDHYFKRPSYPLHAIGIGVSDYIEGPLEDWTRGALQLNGRDQYLVVTDGKLSEPFELEPSEKEGVEGWLTATVPTAVVPEQPFGVQLRLHDAPENQKIAAHLHWLKRDAFGGFNASGGAPRPSNERRFEFSFVPEEKPGLEGFTLTVFLSPSGDWEDRTRVVQIPIAKTTNDPDIEARTVTVGEGDTENSAENNIIVEGVALRNPEVHASSFLVEAYFKTESSQGGVLIEKMGDDAGYSLTVNERGQAVFTLASPESVVELSSRSRLDDGRWHHLIAEADRESRTLALYIDGRQETTGSGIGSETSLANDSDLFVGGTPGGRSLGGAIDFLRISLGTLADAKTTIEELYSWQFDGPFLRDFAGRVPIGERRDAGAIELVD